MSTPMRVVIVNALLLAATALAFFVGLGLSLTGTAVWGEVLWIVAAVLLVADVVWTVRTLILR